MEPLTLAVGAGIALVSWAVGRVTGRREREALSPRAVCEGCTHGLSYHGDDGGCHGTDRRTKYDEHGYNRGQHDFPCTCRRYVGPVPAERMLASLPRQLPEGDPPKTP